MGDTPQNKNKNRDFLRRENGDEPSKFGIVPLFETTQNLDRQVLVYPWEV